MRGFGGPIPSDSAELWCWHPLACMAGRTLRQQSCIWWPQVTYHLFLCSSKYKYLQVNTRGSKHQPSGSGWFLISGFFVCYQPFGSYYFPQQKEMCHANQHLRLARTVTPCSDVGLAPEWLSCWHALPSAGAWRGKKSATVRWHF